MSRVFPPDVSQLLSCVRINTSISKICKVLAVLDDLPATMTPVSRVTGDNDTGNLHTSLTRDYRGVETELQLR